MEYISYWIDFILHVDKYLSEFTASYGTIVYFLLFFIIFVETGLVIFPFLPGDSLIFAAGALAGIHLLNPFLLFAIIFVAAITGDTVNYHIGKNFGHIILRKKWIKEKHLDKTPAFFDKHGGKTIVYARFVPIVRTLAPFVAGISRMRYAYFIHYNLFGALLWSFLFLCLGYFFGTMEIVQKNFSLIIIAIIGLSVLPPFIVRIREKYIFSKRN